ncbi:Pro-apoptotic serine protease NMA111 [Escovopsis weberi]|uniref:Pro-apoptotic serine protease NMA111 n=1 Tax=Escovopsis weberi TaxID=150374 RepID=A0A0M8MZP0_ESCWE|nr:Pro-apoptotic serine protease NMA111 [Escovopsis weberi]
MNGVGIVVGDKRKTPDSPNSDSPPAKRAVMNGKPSTLPHELDAEFELVSDSDDLSDVIPSDDVDGHPYNMFVGTPGSLGEWQDTIHKVVRNVVAIRFCQTRAFDTDVGLTSEATGFVVDSERGYILTNRHVVGAGPFWGHCVFDNHEEVDCYPVYRDPVHDFGILRYDPKAIKYMHVDGLTLSPDQAKVGTEIRVVGNDAGEKLSILSGVISRLDRNAPEYGEGYSDFNTCYYQANAAASGGSSGSPVVSKDGSAVALQAGGRSDGASTDYFLPLDRPLRALQCIQQGKPVTRGDIQCQFLLKPFDECRRLGLSPDWESAVRTAFPQETNMLVAEIVLPLGPSHNKIEEGDVLIKVNGEMITQFIRLDDILDSNVGSSIKFQLQRGGQNVEVDIEIGDLHKITPDRFVSVTGASFHNLSYQQARLYAIAVRGVYVCEAAGSFRFDNNDNGWIIQTVDHKKTPDLDTFIDVVRAVPDKSRVVVTYKHLRDLHTLNTTVIYIDRHWAAKMSLAVRNDRTGLWDFTDLGDPLPPVAPVRRSAAFIELDHMPHPGVADLIRSFVHINCTMPMKLDGFPKNRRWGMGLVIDADKGLVIISRAIVPYDFCDLSITIADSIIVEGKVVFLHPLQNYVIVKYDPSLVDAPVSSARLSPKPLTQGAKTYFLGHNRIGRIVHGSTNVTEITAVAIPANSGAPRYRAINVDAIQIDSNLGSSCNSGVLVDEDGSVQALWLTYLGERSHCSQRDDEYYLGLGTPTLFPVLSAIQRGEEPKLRMLSVEFRAVQMSQAAVMGVSDEWIKKVTQANRSHHQLFMVSKRTFERVDQPVTLLEGDIVLTLNGKICTTISDFDVMYSNELLDAVIVRNCEELRLQLPTVPADDMETNHAVIFCGAILHRPHLAVRQQISKLHSEVYVSSRIRGSPAYQYGVAPTNFITHVNGQPTPDLDSFIAATRKIPDNTYFRLKAVTFDSVPWVITMKKNNHYFPTIEWIKDSTQPCGWRRVTYEGDELIAGEATGAVPAAVEDSEME